MSTIGIVQIHRSINRSRGQYCGICFRSTMETRFVKPVHLKNLLNKLAIRFRGAIQVCYLCEALALSAARFFKTLELAARVSDLFTNMDSAQWQGVLQCVMAPDKYPKVLNDESISRRALDLDAALRAMPRYELRRTDTLVVPSPPQRQDMVVVMQHGNPPISTSMPTLAPIVMAPAMAPTLAPMATTLTHMAPKLAPMATTLAPMATTLAPMATTLAPMATTLAQVAPNLTSMAPALAPMLNAKSKVSIDPVLQHVRVVNKETKQIVLHPMVHGLDGNVYVPSLQLQILDNGILRSAPNIENVTPKLTTVNVTPTLATDNVTPDNATLEDPLKIQEVVSPPQLTPAGKNYSKLRETLQKKDNKTSKKKENNEYYNFLVSQMEERKQKSEVEIIKMNDLNIVLNVDEGESKKKRKRSGGSTEKTLSEVELLLSENAQGGCEIKYEIIDDDDDVEKDKVEPLSRPVLKTDRTVDWEDKIPMDVISFMDATDPNPEERIMQPPPMGIISDVRSVPNDFTEPIECIDLC
ncbi:uncharacterized protein LOC133532744 [Cydia pomonella]|uniref:uncharacterized protein LOC133532744 n=1 Tax=Cydia pomonella TaxID=82600 RepID=UPI002ADD3294|nr:uncharacterized protein LOC133532744 [Cydia pomonella]